MCVHRGFVLCVLPRAHSVFDAARRRARCVPRQSAPAACFRADFTHPGFPSTGDVFRDQHERITALRSDWPETWLDGYDPWTVGEARGAQLAALPYAEYLQTGEWKAKWKAKRRWLIRERSCHGCERCGAYKVKLNVHHLTYERVGHERPEDLEVLCEPCHRSEHGIAA